MPYRQYGSTVLAGVATALVCVAALADETKPVAEEQKPTVQAIRKQQTINFYFQTFSTFYSCSGLEGKLERILQALGADANVKVRSVDCPSSIARTPYVIIDVTSPVEATPEALAAREKDKSRSTRELAARVKGERVADSEAAEQFPAQWQRVSLSRGQLDLQSGDCELMEEVRRKILPKLAVRIVTDNVHCTPGQMSLAQPRLEVEALVEPPKPDDKQKPKEAKLDLSTRFQ